MKYRLMDILACPYDNHFPLQLDESQVSIRYRRGDNARKSLCNAHCAYSDKTSSSKRYCVECGRVIIEEGVLHCPECHRYFPIIDGIPRMIADEPPYFESVSPSEAKGKIARAPSVATHWRGSLTRVQRDKTREMKARDDRAENHFRTPRPPHEQKEIARTLHRLNPQADDFILDAGSGTGRFAVKYLKECREAVMVDFSAASLRMLRQRFSPLADRHYHLVQSDLCFLPFRDEVFDATLSCQVFEHIPSDDERRAALRHVSRVTKNGGKFVISVYNHSWPKKYYRRKGLKDSSVQKEGYHSSGIYYYNFAARELRQLLTDNGFVIKEICGLRNKIPKIGEHDWLDMMLEKTPLSLALGELLLANCRKNQVIWIK